MKQPGKVHDSHTTFKSSSSEPFFTTKDMNSTGLGLWISKDVIEKHDGSPRVRSSQQPAKSGTVFNLFLPFHSVLHDHPTPKTIS